MKKLAKNGLLAAIMLSSFGCGSASNNDGGASVGLLGFTRYESSGCTEIDTTLLTMSISGGSAADNGENQYASPICVKAKNYLTTQTVRIDRASINYFIPGAELQPPSTVAAVPMFLSAATGGSSLPNPNGTDVPTNPGTPPSGTLPPGGGVDTGTETSPMLIIPPAIGEWISTHRNQLPSTPFEIITSVSLSGVTSAGNRLETNELLVTIVVSGDELF